MADELKKLRNLADPLARYVFLDDEGYTEACELVGISENRFLVRSRNEQAFLKKRSGYFVGKEGKGILRFRSVMEKVASLKVKSENLYWISPDMGRCESINRRLFNRYQLKYVVPIYLKTDLKEAGVQSSAFMRSIKASLINISESGLRMTVGEKLPSNLPHCLELTLPCGKEYFNFRSDGIVVYCEPESDSALFLTGVSFVAPHFNSDEDRLFYQRKRFDLGVFLKANPHYFDLV